MSRRISRPSKLRSEVTVDGYSYLQDRTEQPAVADRAASAGETPCASSLYHRGRRARAWLVSGQAVTRHPAHHARPAPVAGRRCLRNPAAFRNAHREYRRAARSPRRKYAGQRSPRHDRAHAGNGGRLPRPNPKSAAPNRFIPKISLRLAFPRRHSPIAFKSRRCGKPFCA